MSLRAVTECLESGWAIDEIAEEVDLPVEEVCRLVRLAELRGELDIKRPLADQIADCRDGGLTWCEIAGLLNIDPDTARMVGRRLRRPGGAGRPKVYIDQLAVRRMREQGMSFASIGRELGVDRQTIHSRAKEWGL